VLAPLCHCVSIQEGIRRDTQAILYAHNIIRGENQVQISTAFGEARNILMAAEPERGFDHRSKQDLLLEIIHDFKLSFSEMYLIRVANHYEIASVVSLPRNDLKNGMFVTSDTLVHFRHFSSL
jgi:hypothetical protein